MRESTIVTLIKAMLLKEFGVHAHKYHGDQFSENFVSDLFGTLPGGRAFYIEVKTPKTMGVRSARRKGQELWQEREKEAGAWVMFTDSVDKVREALISSGFKTLT